MELASYGSSNNYNNKQQQRKQQNCLSIDVRPLANKKRTLSADQKFEVRMRHLPAVWSYSSGCTQVAWYPKWLKWTYCRCNCNETAPCLSQKGEAESDFMFCSCDLDLDLHVSAEFINTTYSNEKILIKTLSWWKW